MAEQPALAPPVDGAEQAPTAASTAATEPALPSSGETSSAGGPSVLVFNPASSSAPTEVDDAFFEPTLTDVQAYHASIVSRSARLNDAPLLTAKHRDEAARERERRTRDKWPTTTIRVKFSDGTQIQSVFPSNGPIQPVYAFVRSALAPAALSVPFTLYQPPRTLYPERPPPAAAAASKKRKPAAAGGALIIPPANYGPVRGVPARGLQGGTGGAESLHELGLVPQSVLLVRWDDGGMNASTYPAPLKDDLKAKSVPLPPARLSEASIPASSGESKGMGTGTAEKKMPKWLAKGLMKM
ncbi:hypothetical protein Q5752_001019 [Cryptotrichosporon argae]